jgi:predicted esterase
MARPLVMAGALLASLLAAGSSGAQPAPSVNIDEPPSTSQVAALRKRVRAASQLVAGVAASQRGAAAARLSLQHEARRLEELLRPRRVPCNPEPEVKRLEADAAMLGQGAVPHEAPGVHRLAYRSPLDRRVHPFAMYVPPSYAGSRRRFPLVVMLHGMGSSPMRCLGRLFGVGERELRDARIVCDRPSLGPVETLVVAPGGFGDALYRVVGEVDVRAVVRAVMDLYRVDGGRVTITGLSMGGTGAVEIALQHPQTYAGVLALCGYYDRRQDSTVQKQPLLPWENHLMSVHSPLDWAANGRGIPLLLVHGTEDGPGRAKRLQERYETLGYKVELELFPRGHDVWVPGYKDGRALPLLAKLRKGGPPRRVSLATGRPRVRRAYWVQIDRFVDHGAWAQVEAEVQGKTRVKVTTKNVAALRLDLPAAHLSRGKPIGLMVDGTELETRRGARRVALSRAASAWRLLGASDQGDDAPAVLRKRPGLSGPMEDIYFDPVVIVYGTGRGQGERLRAVAKKLAGYRKHVTLSYPVISDRQLRSAVARNNGLILVGTEEENGVLGRIADRLPIRVHAAEVLLGARRYRAPHLGVTFIYPNPEAPDRYVRVVAGTTPRAYEIVEVLPIYLPDYLVFDEGMASKRTSWPSPILGAKRSLVAGGTFDERWQLRSPPVSVKRAPSTQPAK